MKVGTLTAWAVTLDQRDSRHHEDAVPRLLARLGDEMALPAPEELRVSPPTWLLPPERTAGDEVQGLTDDPATLVAALWLASTGDWWIGVGHGRVDTPLPASTRAARGTAYVRAREGLQEAKEARLIVGTRGDPGRTSRRVALAVETLVDVGSRLSGPAREVADLYDRSMSTTQAAEALGISAPAVSQRLSRRRWAQLVDIRQLVCDLASDQQEQP